MIVFVIRACRCTHCLSSIPVLHDNDDDDDYGNVDDDDDGAHA